MKTKYFSTSPNDENNSLTGNDAHTENSAAYKKFVTPKKEYKQIDLSEIDFESEANNLYKKDILD